MSQESDFSPIRLDARLARLYLWRMLLLFIVGVSAAGASLIVLSHSGRLAAPLVSDSFSFNEKLAFLKRNPVKHATVLCVGSSLAVNNLESSVFVRKLDVGSSYINAAAFGMKIGHTSHLLIDYLPRYQPEFVVLPMGLVDFVSDKRKSDHFDLKEIGKYLNGRPDWIEVCLRPDLRYFFGHARDLTRTRSDRSAYTSLCFDSWGGVPLEVFGTRIDPERWKGSISPQSIDSVQYDELRGLCLRVAAAGAVLVCVRTPQRADSIGAEIEDKVEAHWRRVREIAESSGMRYVDLHSSLPLADDEYADYSHLNSEGAKRVGEALGGIIETMMRERLAPQNGSSIQAGEG